MLKELIAQGVIKAPLALERIYKGQRFTAQVESDGTVTFDGERFNSLSTAAAMARAKALKVTGYQSTNGWVFWEFCDERGRRLPVDALRKGAARP